MEPLCTSMKEEAWAGVIIRVFWARRGMTAAELHRHGAKLQWRWKWLIWDLACPGAALCPPLSLLPVTSAPCLLQILGEPKQNRKLVAEVSLKNPLTVALSGCTFTVEGAGLIEEQKTVDV